MSTIRRPAASLPPEARSALPGKRGVSAWAAVALAVALSAVGFLADWARYGDLAGIFSALYFVGCVGAIVMVRQRSLFAAMVQPPLILFFGVPLCYFLMTMDDDAGLRSRVIEMVIPLVTRFPLMLLTSAVVVVVGGFRLLTSAREPGQNRQRARPARRAAGTASRP